MKGEYEYINEQRTAAELIAREFTRLSYDDLVSQNIDLHETFLRTLGELQLNKSGDAEPLNFDSESAMKAGLEAEKNVLYVLGVEDSYERIASTSSDGLNTAFHAR